jgi:PmbA protein
MWATAVATPARLIFPKRRSRTVQAAYDIARFTAEDPFAALPDAKTLRCQHEQRTDLDLFHPWAITSEQAAQLAMECEAAACRPDKRITNSEGAGVSAQQSHFFSAHTHRVSGRLRQLTSFACRCRPLLARVRTCSATLGTARCAMPKTWPAPEAIGRYAAERALSRLKSRKIATTECPVLFESPLAAGLLGSFVQAISGGALVPQEFVLARFAGQAGAAQTH